MEPFKIGDYIYLTAIEEVIHIQSQDFAEFASREEMRINEFSGAEVIIHATQEQIEEYKRSKRNGE